MRKSFNQIKANQQHQNGSEQKKFAKKTSTNALITTQIETNEDKDEDEDENEDVQSVAKQIDSFLRK